MSGCTGLYHINVSSSSDELELAGLKLEQKVGFVVSSKLSKEIRQINKPLRSIRELGPMTSHML